MTEKEADTDLNVEFHPQPFGRISQCNWFWQNYHSALDWQKQHAIHYWKNRSLTLEYENAKLQKYLYKYNGASKILSYNTTSKNATKNKKRWKSKKSKKRKLECEENEEEEEEEAEEDEEEKVDDDDEETLKFEFQVTENMMEFFEQSMKHKLELEKQREEERGDVCLEEGSDEDSCLPSREDLDLLRLQEMKLLYGEAAPKIMAMETAMQQSVDRFCRVNKPQVWPVVPLK